jgi:CMP-N,N'-diacetyllegionaminic acid synthase
MIGTRRVIALIPARGGSKGLPGKNIAPLGDRPLIAWSIEAAKASRHVDDVAVTTDDPAIAAIARQWGATVVERPAELATDTAPIEGALFHAVDTLGGGWEILVLLQPTSPLRRPEDIDACIETMSEAKAPCALTVCDPGKSPYWMYTLTGDRRMNPVVPGIEGRRRQDLPEAYALNGAVYVADIAWLRANGKFMSPETVACLMPRERSVDIDSAHDLIIAKAIIAAAGQV